MSVWLNTCRYTAYMRIISVLDFELVRLDIVDFNPVQAYTSFIDGISWREYAFYYYYTMNYLQTFRESCDFICLFCVHSVYFVILTLTL